jgi:hypothetical protein
MFGEVTGFEINDSLYLLGSCDRPHMCDSTPNFVEVNLGDDDVISQNVPGTPKGFGYSTASSSTDFYLFSGQSPDGSQLEYL